MVEKIYFQREPYQNLWMELFRWQLMQRLPGSTEIVKKNDFSYDVFIFSVSEKSRTEDFLAFLEPDMECFSYGGVTYDGVQKAYSKATAIASMQNYLNLDLDQIYVFGDSGNDAAMFAYAKHAIAMGTHDENLAKMAEYVTDTVERDGLYKAMKHYQLI